MKKIFKVIYLITFLTIICLTSSCSNHEHNYELYGNELKHYYQCQCGKITNMENHDSIWITDKAATKESPGYKHQECLICKTKHSLNTVINPLKGNPLKFNTDVGPVFGTMPAFQPFINYDIFIESDSYDYGEEFQIHLWISPVFQTHDIIAEGDLKLKIEESDSYEVIGKKEVVIKNFSADSDRTYIQFTIKAVDKSNLVDKIQFKLKFNYKEKGMQDYLSTSTKAKSEWINLDEEYFYSIDQLVYIADSKGIMLAGKKIIMDIYDAENNLFYKSINREYNSNTIDKNEYIKKCYQHVTKDQSYIYVNDEYIRYVSKNIRAYFYIDFDYEEVKNLYNSDNESEKQAYASELIYLLYNQNYISEETYLQELEYIKTKGITTKNKGLKFDLMEIDFDFIEYKNEYIIYWVK